MKAAKVILNILMALFLGQAIAPFFNMDPLILGGALYAAHIISQPKLAGVMVFKDVTLNDTSYEGTVLKQFIALATTTFNTLEKGCINVLAGIKKKASIPSIKVDAFIQARVETPQSQHSGGVTIDRRTLEPQDFMGYLEFNPRDFEQHVLSTELNPELLDAELPATAESAITQEVIKLNKAYLDKAIWRSEKDDAAIATAKANGLGAGDNNLIFLDGLQRKLFMDNGVYRDPVPSAITAANVFAKFETIAANLPNEVYEDPNFKFLLAGANRSAYTDAQKAQSYKGVDKTQRGVLLFDGKPVVTIDGMSPNTIWGGKASDNLSSNLWLGVNEVDEDEYLKLMRLANNSELFFIKMLYKMDVNYGWAEECGFHMTESYL